MNNKKIMLIVLIIGMTSICALLASYFVMDELEKMQNKPNESAETNDLVISEIVQLKTQMEQLVVDAEQTKTTLSQTQLELQTMKEQIAANNAKEKENDIKNPVTDKEENTDTVKNEKKEGTVKYRVHLRKEPTTDAKILKSFVPNEKIVIEDNETVSANGYEWVRVTDSKGKTGWMASEYLKK